MQEYEIALFAFNTLTLAAPDNPMIRYHSASLYIELGQIPEALTELQALSKIIEQNQLHDWQSQYETLLKKAQI
jgi:predicted Zn-dependent protease